LFNKSTKEDNLALGQVSIDARWGWLAMVDRLSNGDITKHDEVYQRNYIECLNLLSYWYERDKFYEQQNEIKNRTYRHG
jgi:hypothetical protein